MVGGFSSRTTSEFQSSDVFCAATCRHHGAPVRLSTSAYISRRFRNPVWLGESTQAIDSFDLSKPEPVNLRRRHICGGLLSNCPLVPSSTVRQAVQSDCGPTARNIVLCDEIRETAIRGEHLRIHCPLDLFRQALLVLGRDGRGKLLRRGQERIFGNSAFALTRFLLDQNLDRRQSVSFSLAEHLDCLLESKARKGLEKLTCFV